MSKREDRKAQRDAMKTREGKKMLKMREDYRDLQKIRERVKEREIWLRRLLDKVAKDEEYEHEQPRQSKIS